MTDSVNAYWLRLLNADYQAELEFGRHIVLNYPDATNKIQRRHYSIVGRRGDDQFEIAIKRQSDDGVAAQIHRTLTERSMITASEVTGNLTCKTLLAYPSVLMVCGGMGITQPISLLLGLAKLKDQGETVPKVHLIACVPFFGELVYFTKLLAMQAQFDWLTVEVFVTREKVRAGITYLSEGRPGAKVLTRIAFAPAATVLCGSSAFVNEWANLVGNAFPSSATLDKHLGDRGCDDTTETSIDAATSSKLVLAGRKLELDAPRNQSLLDTLLRHGVEVPHQCRIGLCGRCSVRVLEGDVDSTSDIGLSGSERDAGYRLACCSRPRSESITLSI